MIPGPGVLDEELYRYRRILPKDVVDNHRKLRGQRCRQQWVLWWEKANKVAIAQTRWGRGLHNSGLEGYISSNLTPLHPQGVRSK